MHRRMQSAYVAFTVILIAGASGAQAAVQSTQHEHPAPTAKKPAVDALKSNEGMKDMHAMMADPAMREKMMANMAQCREMMSMMMEHMKHEGKPGDSGSSLKKH